MTDASNKYSHEAALFDGAGAERPAESGAAERTADMAVVSSKAFHGISRAADKVISRSYRTVNLKSIAIREVEELAKLLSSIDGARVAYCMHTEDGFVPHYHLVAQFPTPQHLKKALLPIAVSDPCFYLRPCRLFRNSYRYLAHLDNPDKHRVDVKSIVHLGDWEGTDLAKWQSARLLVVTMNELVFLCRDYLRSTKAPNAIDFAVWLDDNLVSSRSSLAGLRMMGITVDQLFDYARKLLQPIAKDETDPRNPF